MYFPLFSSRRYLSVGSGKSGANREGGGAVGGCWNKREGRRFLGRVGGI